MSDTIQIQVDITKSQGELEHAWRYIGYDECNYTYIPEGKELLQKFHDLGDAPYYIRTHFTFCTGNCHGTYKFGSTNLYHESQDGNPVYNYDFFDKIIDTYLETGHKPFMELGFMPMDLVDQGYLHPKKKKWDIYNQYKEIGWTCPPKSYEKWHDLIKHVAGHLKDRYGEAEVNSWYFELWNEPDIFYWSGTAAEYCKLFDFTEDALHEVLPLARLAGPAVTGIFEGTRSQKYFEYFLNHCKNGANFCNGRIGTRLDYITFHVKGGGFPFQINAQKSMPSVDSLVYQVKLGLESMKKFGYEDREVVLSEADPDGWAAGGVYDNANMIFRNTEYYATYVASIYDKIDQLSRTYQIKIRPLAWAFLFPGERCFEGTRTFTTQGIDKPILNLFKMFGKLGSERLYFESDGARCPAYDAEPDIANPTESEFDGETEGSDVTGMAVRGKNGETQILIYSHTGDRDACGNRSVQVAVAGYGDASVKISHYRIDREHSNAYAEWVRQGEPMYPQGEVYKAIKAKDQLELLKMPEEIQSKANRLALQFDMPAHGVSLIIINQ